MYLHKHWRELRRSHPRTALPRLVWRLGVEVARRCGHRRWELIVYERDNRHALLPAIPRHRASEHVVVRLATPDDAPLWDQPEWRHFRRRFRRRMRSLPGYGVLIAVVDGRLVSQGPFAIGSYRDRMLRHSLDPGPRGVVWHDGETLPDWRGRGVANVAMNWFFRHLREQHDCDRILTTIQVDNIASRRLHERYGFRPVRLLVWRQLGPLRWTRPRPLPETLRAPLTRPRA